MAVERKSSVLSSEYRGPDRRISERRQALESDEIGWRLVNFALNGNEQRAALGRRSSDLAVFGSLGA
ncbi:hypothetical protein [Parachitinimonas caeni]|uniref:Uncharacterized protein n=1 Tax=Parachitinimonas caeni TaxID=3031301 RepID=A0ABT7DWR3_9NEIS|nr:hypothetical protein [Parachitinimonas caeni]MDK2123087.1 hypothetical protein [Parachitinimonas caeni]